jgi:hypothetical protein
MTAPTSATVSGECSAMTAGSNRANLPEMQVSIPAKCKFKRMLCIGLITHSCKRCNSQIRIHPRLSRYRSHTRFYINAEGANSGHSAADSDTQLACFKAAPND